MKGVMEVFQSGDSMSENFRDTITFEQAAGLHPLPTQLRINEVSPALKARLWAIVHSQIEHSTGYSGSLNDPMYNIARRYMIDRAHILIDEWDNDAYKLTNIWKKHFSAEATFSDVLGFTEWLLRTRRDSAFARAVGTILTQERAAYRLEGVSIVPVASPEEGEAIVQALRLANTSALDGVRSHITKASTALTAGDYAGSVRESIHAVEAVVFSKTGVTGSFTAALKVLNKAQPMHEAFQTALVKLYAYTSNEPGVRHSLFDKGDTNVTERDALFMLGICASFVTYLLKTEGTPKE